MDLFKSRREILSKLSLGLVSIPLVSTVHLMESFEASPKPVDSKKGFTCRITTMLPVSVEAEHAVSSVFKQWYDTEKMDQLVEEYTSSKKLQNAEFSFHGNYTNWVVTFESEAAYKSWVKEIANRNIVNVEEQLRQGYSVIHTPLRNT